MNRKIEDIRKDYTKDVLEINDLSSSPIKQFESWFSNALKSNVLEANALVLSTISNDGMPNARVVLLKGITSMGFKFFTNYNSEKGRELDSNPQASMTFFWPELEQQVRIMGSIEKLSAEDSDAYFNSRPQGSKISAIASNQSSKVDHRDELTHEVKRLESLYKNGGIKRPDHWGGYLLKPSKVEFWQGRPSRLHDRFLYELIDGVWCISRLAP